MLKSADLHETILTPVICHKHVRCHDGVTLYFSMKFPSVAPKEDKKWTFFDISADLKQPKKNGDFELLSIPAVQQTEQGFHHNQFPKM